MKLRQLGQDHDSCEGEITHYRGMPNRLSKPHPIPKIQLAQRQASEYQEVGMPFGLGYGVASSYPQTLSQSILESY